MSEDDFSEHGFGPGVVKELATKLYKNPIAAYREAVSNALDAMVPYPGEQRRIDIFTNVPPNGDISIEDWGTGIEDYKNFKIISPGEKIVKNEVSSYEKINEKIIGQKGMGKLSYLNLSDTNTVEFYSNNEQIGMQIIMTMRGFNHKYMNSDIALPHRGLKIVIKNPKRPIVPETRLIEYLSRTFAIRIARGAKIYVNKIQVNKPEGFDSRQYPLFNLKNGTKVTGNLKSVENPKLNNLDLYVKTIFVDSKELDFKVAGWINCDVLELDTSRDGIYEAGNLYMNFMDKLMKHLEENFDKKSDNKDKGIKSSKEISKIFVQVIKSIQNLFPDLTKPLLSGYISNERGFGNLSHLLNDINSPCIEQAGIIDNYNGELVCGTTIGHGTKHKNTKGGESTIRIREGNGRILAPSTLSHSGNGQIPEPKVVVLGVEDKPVIYFNAPNRLVINSLRPSSKILIEAKPKDSAFKSRILPLLVRAGIDAFPGSSEISKEEWFKKYDAVLDNVYQNEQN